VPIVACLKWPSPERSKEAIQEIGTWMDSVGEEMEAQTTPGVLRAVKVKPEVTTPADLIPEEG